jgi:hypothetical protein
MMDPGILRALERLLDAAIGGLSIYLGYRLFLRLPDKTDSQGKIILPGKISIFLSRVGPGVFLLSSELQLSHYRCTMPSTIVLTEPKKGLPTLLR